MIPVDEDNRTDGHTKHVHRHHGNQTQRGNTAGYTCLLWSLHSLSPRLPANRAGLSQSDRAQSHVTKSPNIVPELSLETARLKKYKGPLFQKNCGMGFKTEAFLQRSDGYPRKCSH